MNYKIFEVNECYVLTKTKEEAIEICVEEGKFDDLDMEYLEIKECNYKDQTWQPITVLKNIFMQNELDKIETKLSNTESSIIKIKNNIKYYFEETEFGYNGVLLSLDQILNNPKLLSEFELDTIIAGP